MYLTRMTSIIRALCVAQSILLLAALSVNGATAAVGLSLGGKGTNFSTQNMHPSTQVVGTSSVIEYHYMNTQRDMWVELIQFPEGSGSLPTGGGYRVMPQKEIAILGKRSKVQRYCMNNMMRRYGGGYLLREGASTPVQVMAHMTYRSACADQNNCTEDDLIFKCRYDEDGEPSGWSNSAIKPPGGIPHGFNIAHASHEVYTAGDHELVATHIEFSQPLQYFISEVNPISHCYHLDPCYSAEFWPDDNNDAPWPNAAVREVGDMVVYDHDVEHWHVCMGEAPGTPCSGDPGHFHPDCKLTKRQAIRRKSTVEAQFTRNGPKYYCVVIGPNTFGRSRYYDYNTEVLPYLDQVYVFPTYDQCDGSPCGGIATTQGICGDDALTAFSAHVAFYGDPEIAQRDGREPWTPTGGVFEILGDDVPLSGAPNAHRIWADSYLDSGEGYFLELTYGWTVLGDQTHAVLPLLYKTEERPAWVRYDTTSSPPPCSSNCANCPLPPGLESHFENCQQAACPIP